MDGWAYFMIMQSVPLKTPRHFHLIMGEVLRVEDKEKWHFFIIPLDIKGTQSIESDVMIAHTKDKRHQSI